MVGVSAYEEIAASDEAEAAVLQHANLVKRIAYHLLSRLPPSVLLEDLIQVGMMGLIEASRHYDPSQGASFETYAGIRIRGAMLDEIRRGDWTPRSVHRKSREVADVVRGLENRLGRDPSDSEIATAMEISLDEYHQILQDNASSRLLSIEELTELGMGPSANARDVGQTPGFLLEREGFKGALVAAIAALPERERLVVSLYYDDELNLREIGEVLNVSESRVCQIHSQAAARLRAKLKDWLSEDDKEETIAQAKHYF